MLFSLHGVGNRLGTRQAGTYRVERDPICVTQASKHLNALCTMLTAQSNRLERKPFV
jgi:hypothetical protein